MGDGKIQWKEIMPAWYELEVCDEMDLGVNIHPAGLSLVTRIKPTAPIVVGLENRFELLSFVPSSDPGRFGFGGVVSRLPDDERGWIRYRCPMPVVKEKGADARYEAAASVRATLSLLFLCLMSGPEKETGYSVPQMVIVDSLLIEYGLQGASLSAILTPAMNPFLLSACPEELDSIAGTMRATAEHMWQDEERNKLLRSSYSVLRQEPSAIHLNVPGSFSGLDPTSGSGRYDGPKHGYRLWSHNVDGGLQQLALLMGLARLSELGRTRYL